MSDILDLDAWELGEKLHARALSPVDVTDAYLARIDQLDEKINAYITVTADVARRAASEAEKEIIAGRWRGPFHGVPVALKDLCYTEGVLTTGGSKILAEFVPNHDSTVWARLKSQGAVLLGKLNLHEFAYGVTSTNPHWGTVHNPYNLAHIPGGSSGGSAAAIVAGLAPATIGTDTGGSIRIPAAFCGCVGFKATWSRVSRYGVMPLADSMDHVGPITRSVRDAAMMLAVIAGRDPNDGTSSGEPVPDYSAALNRDLKGVRIGIIKEMQTRISDDVWRGFHGAMAKLRELGAVVEDVPVPALEDAIAASTALGAEAFEFHEKWLRERPADYGADVRLRLEGAALAMAREYIRAQRSRAAMLADALDALEGRDVLLAPVSTTPAPLIGDPGTPVDAHGQPVDIFETIIRFTLPFDLTGQPALAIPTGLAPSGLPLSMQIIGRPFDEMAVIRVADAYERARGPLTPPKL